MLSPFCYLLGDHRANLDRYGILRSVDRLAVSSWKVKHSLWDVTVGTKGE